MKHFLAALALLSLLFVNAPARAEADKIFADKVFVGVHVNDIQEINMRNHSYRMDFYVWFRWRDEKLNPAATAEFMNAFDPASHVRTALYDKPQKMPDGSLYMILRDQGEFSTKFPLQQYPFDQQKLSVMVEDSLHDKNELVYVPDTVDDAPVTMNGKIYLPGFNLGEAALNIGTSDYPTRFGDISQKEQSSYSRAEFSVPVTRPWLASSIKIFLPIALVLFCTGLIFLVHPVYIEGRLGVAITALLTLVALQLTSASSLPDVDYLLLTDKIYLLSYFFIIATLMQLVVQSGRVQAGEFNEVRSRDRVILLRLTAGTIAALVLVVVTALA